MGARRALSSVLARGDAPAGAPRVTGLALGLLATVVAAAALGCTSAVPANQAVAKKPGKVTPELLALYASYRDAQQRGVRFHPDSAVVRVVEDRVLIDATAAADGQQLEGDLVSLGMRHASTFGRVVSGQLPISAIPRLDALGSLAFARATSAATWPRGSPTIPSRP